MEKKTGSSYSFRDNYNTFGVGGYYTQFGDTYRNPHEYDINSAMKEAFYNRWLQYFDWKQPKRIYDLACGSGEVTLFFDKLGKALTEAEQLPEDHITTEATDPYTYKAFEERVGRPAEQISFEDIENGKLWGRHYNMIISSFAMHLIDETRLLSTCNQMAFIADYLVIISPHKKPEINESMGWTLKDEFVHERIHMRIYESLYKENFSL